MKKYPAHVVMLILMLMMTACASRAERATQYSAPASMPVTGDQDGLMEPQASTGGAPGKAVQAQSVQRIVIKKASISLVVLDPGRAMEAIAQMAEANGGYVVSANQYETEIDSGVKVPRATVTIRVAAEKLNDVMGKIKALSERAPLNVSVESQDVTSEYTDLQSRLRNLEAAETKLTSIMDAAVKTEDVMAVYNQLLQVREQIEVLKGQIKYYEQSAALSSVTVDLQVNQAVQPLTIGGWQPVGVAREAIQALINALKFLANAFIWIVLFFLPVLVVLFVVFVLPVRLLWRAWRRQRGQKKAPPPPAAQG